MGIRGISIHWDTNFQIPDQLREEMMNVERNLLNTQFWVSEFEIEMGEGYNTASEMYMRLINERYTQAQRIIEQTSARSIVGFVGSSGDGSAFGGGGGISGGGDVVGVGVGVGVCVGGSGTIDVCTPFQMGSCTRGSSCPLRHVSGNAGLDGRNRSGLGIGLGIGIDIGIGFDIGRCRGRGRGRGRGSHSSLIGASVEQPTNIGNSVFMNSTVANTRPVQSHKQNKKTIDFFNKIEKLEWRHARTTEDKFGFWSPAKLIRNLSPLTTREQASAVLHNFNRITRYVIEIILIY